MANIKYQRLAFAALAIAAFRDDTAEAQSGTNTAAAEVKPTAPAPTSPFVTMEPVVFHFKKEKIRDENGKEVGEGKKLPSAHLYLPVPTNDRLVQILQGGDEFAKERSLLRSAVQDLIYGQARAQVNDFREKDENKDKEVTLAVLNFDKLDFTAIANLPPRERASSIPADEDINAFLAVYAEIMPAALNKDAKKIATHVELFKSGFKKQRSQKEFLEVFKNALDVFAATVQPEVMEEQLAVWEYYYNKLDRFLQSEEKLTLNDI